MICEAPIIIDCMHSVLDALATWAEDVGINDVFVIDGIAIRPVLVQTVILRSIHSRTTAYYFTK
jgi:hypothetical protein